MPKIQQISSKVTKSLFVTIPFEFARLKGWKKGDTLVFGVDSRSGKVVLDKLEEVVPKSEE